MIFEFNNKCFELKSNNERIKKYFKDRLIITNKKTSNYIEIDEKKTILNVKNKKIIINNNLNNTDLYQIYNNYLSYLSNSPSSLYIHSSIISKNNKGILLIGNFGQGKTTLACEAMEYGYDINSTDHTLIEICNSQLYMKFGSSYMKENEFIYNISTENTKKKIKIIKIVLLYGLSNNGDFSIENIDKKHVLKRLYPFSSWSYDTPLITDPSIELYNSKDNIISFLHKLDNINIDVSIVRGDNKKIIKYFDSYLSSIDNDKNFINGIINNDKSLIMKSQIADLHVHGALGSSKKIYKLQNIESLDGYTGLKKYIKDHIDSSDIEKYTNLLINTIKTEIKDGVTYLEMSIDIRFYDFFDTVDDYINTLRKIKNRFNIIIKYDIGISKSTSTTKFNLIIELIKSRFFSGIDLYGNENLNNYEKFKDIYDVASIYHLKRKVHIGECLNTIELDNALILNPNVIQHGISVVNLLNLEKYTNITFNVCVSSNIILGYVPSINSHPIREMYDLGLKVTINTDDQLIFGKSIIDEYKLLYENNIFDEKELNEIRKNGIY